MNAITRIIMAIAKRGGTAWSTVARKMGYDASKGAGANLTAFLGSDTFKQIGYQAVTAYLVSYAYDNFGIVIDEKQDDDWSKLLEIFSGATDASRTLGNPFNDIVPENLNALRLTTKWALQFFGGYHNMMEAHTYLQAFCEYDHEALKKAYELLNVSEG